MAISGLHIALIAGILVSLLRVLRVPRRGAGLVVIPLIWFYTAATGWQASAIRSTIMMTVIIAGWALRRPSNLINSLAGSALIILIWDPGQLFQAGFQLSFFVVLGLALIVPPLDVVRERLLQPDPLLPPELRPRWQRVLDRPLTVVSASLATSLAAWLGSMPLIAFYFNTVTPCSLLANLVAVPLSSLALMSSLGALVCGDWLPFVTELFNHSSWLWMLWMMRLSEWFASWPGAYFYVRSPPLAGSLTYYVLLGGVLSGLFVSPRWRWWAWTGAACLLSGWLIRWQMTPDFVRITVLPGRACSTFIDQPGPAPDLLVDCGDADAAQAMVKPYLRAQGVNRLPSLLLTHGDVGHAGGAVALSRHFRVKEIVTSPVRFRSPAYRELTAALEKGPGAAGARARVWDGRDPPTWKRVERGATVGPWSVLHPAARDTWRQGNEQALVLRGVFAGTSVLLMSDLGRLGQRALLERENGRLQSDVLVVGITAGDGLSPGLLDAVRPRLVIVGCGESPATARPSARLRERLAELNVPVIYTSDRGAATLALGPGGWKIETR